MSQSKHTVYRFRVCQVVNGLGTTQWRAKWRRARVLGFFCWVDEQDIDGKFHEYPDVYAAETREGLLKALTVMVERIEKDKARENKRKLGRTWSIVTVEDVAITPEASNPSTQS